jgi:hypothetical protein
MDDILRRFGEDLIGRSTGPMNLRLVIQPAVASVLAIRAGLKDAREGRPAFLWAAITNPAYRPELLRQGSRDVGTPLFWMPCTSSSFSTEYSYWKCWLLQRY